MEEVWKPVSIFNKRWFDGNWKYEVSNLGQVRITAHETWNGALRPASLVKQFVDKFGYHTVALHAGTDRRKRFYVHRLVAIEFVENKDNMPNVLHNDRNRSNNRADNLSWGKRHEKIYTEVQPVKRDNSVRVSTLPVRQYGEDGRLIAVYSNAKEAAKAVFVSSHWQILQCCRRVRHYNTCGGYIWRFTDDDEFAEGEQDEKGS